MDTLKHPSAAAGTLPETRRRSRTYQILLSCLLEHLRRPQGGEVSPAGVPSRQTAIPVHPAQEAA